MAFWLVFDRLAVRQLATCHRTGIRALFLDREPRRLCMNAVGPDEIRINEKSKAFNQCRCPGESQF